MRAQAATKEINAFKPCCTKKFYPLLCIFSLVIELGMGKSSKKKPMTKKEREARRKKRKEKRLK
jgi:hypothetical protein